MSCQLYVHKLTRGTWLAIHAMLATGAGCISVHVAGMPAFTVRRKA